MPFNLNKIFTTITANPFQYGSYIEIEPCENLKPYIKCFWANRQNTTYQNVLQEDTLVIPDICMDIIITSGEENIYSNFCGINDKAFISNNNSEILFGIRFYAWSVVLFSDKNMNGVINAFFDADTCFSDFSKNFAKKLQNANTFWERKSISEKYLIDKLNPSRENCDIMNSLYYIIRYNGKSSVSDLSDYCVISKRQLERKFIDNTGVSPKQMINLIRYQLLWQESLKSKFNVYDSIEKFGYYDQSHLLKEFKKYHSISLSQARNLIKKMSRFYNTK